jgi:Rhodopirellula transposase DDE domain
MTSLLVGFVVKEPVEKKLQQEPELVKVFAQVVEDYTAGSPTEQNSHWTGLKPREIQQKLKDSNYEVSFYIVHQLLDNAGLARRSYLKALAQDQVAQRDDQFRHISLLKERFLEAGMPVLSIDTKQKELLGKFYRPGHYYDKVHRKVNDHDFRSSADGILVPHGIYDVGDNYGYLTLGTSHDTSAFVCDNLAHFWQEELQWKYPDADWMLLLCDGGGSNNARHYLVKEGFWTLAQKLDLNIVVAHYPPYCSKWNPIEHRFFCHLHHAWEGTIFMNLQIVKEQAEKTQTQTGLGIKVWVNPNEYPTGRKVNPVFRDNIIEKVHFDQNLPQWNYSFLMKNREVIF